MIINDNIIVFNNYGINDFFRYMLLNKNIQQNIDYIMELFDTFILYDNSSFENIFISTDDIFVVYDIFNNELHEMKINNNHVLYLMDVKPCNDYVEMINIVKNDFDVDVTYHMIYVDIMY